MPSYYRAPDAPEPNVPRKIGVTAIIERNGDVLVERRADSAVIEWAFIGGSLDDDSVLEALHREVLEETGFEVEQASLLGIFSDPSRIVAYADGNVCRVTSIAFRVTVADSSGPRLSSESAEMRFVRLDELADLPFWPIHQPIREAFLGDPATPVVV